jgi:hypothetical protein
MLCHLSYVTSPFCLFSNRVSSVYAGWLLILPISASQVASITGMSHHARLLYFLYNYRIQTATKRNKVKKQANKNHDKCCLPVIIYNPYGTSGKKCCGPTGLM